MTALATDTDLEDRLGRALTTAEDARVGALLDDASARIRSYTRQTFTAVTNDVVKLRPVGMKIRLPQRPVTAVNGVTAIGWAGIPSLPLPAGFWGWDGIDIVELAPLSSGSWINLPEVELGEPDTYEIDYDHGSASVPDDVIAVCCAMVLRVLLAPSMTEGMNTERIGQYSYGMQQGGGGSPGASVRLTEQDKDDLKDYRRKATTVQVTL